jgi:hypothetical protein
MTKTITTKNVSCRNALVSAACAALLLTGGAAAAEA